MSTYRRDRSYRYNYEHGPRFRGPFPTVPRVPEKDFFGFRVPSRVGIAAGLLLNSAWVECYAKLGFDILTYKTVRTVARRSHPMPNWLLVDAPGGLDVREDQVLRVRKDRPRASDPSSWTSAVCFGMPSMSPDVWRRDVARARKKLGSGQILIVSVVGTPSRGGGEDELVEDYRRAARWAAEAGAHIVEANLSCPNVCTAEGTIYHDAKLVRVLAIALRDALPSTPLFVKVGHLGSERAARSLYEALDGKVDAAVLVNGIARRVVQGDGRPAFGRFDRVGILGAAIHSAAVADVRRAITVTEAGGLRVGTVAVGGVTTAGDPGAFFRARARGVLLGSAPAFDPLLAVRMKADHPDW